MNKPQREDVVKQATNAGYHVNADGDFQKGNKKISLSDSGLSINVNGHRYNSSSDVKKSGRV